jgi:DNA topoisomerase-1
MTKKESGKTLVVVESPTKAKTLSKILGSKYTVKASIGHIKDLPKSRIAIDVENNFQPEYILVKGKAKIKNELVKLARGSQKILLASDPDREGEAIAWHLCNILDVDPQTLCRIRFYEVTPKAVKEALKKLEPVDMNRVNAQQARRVLDRLVGYTLSPLLWKKIRYGLSAGRVQSVALNLICEREREIISFVPSEYWHISVLASSLDKTRNYDLKVMSFKNKSFWKEGKPLLISSSEQAEKIASDIAKQELVVKEYKVKEGKRAPLPPFKTSTLQQEAARRLGFSPRRTMRIAQSLFEGVSVPGRGPVGLITYMRTDSLRIAPDAINGARTFISERYEAKYLPAKPNFFASKARSQDAHEAIRPTDVTLTPEILKNVLNSEQHRLYTLIWNRFVASQMASALVANAILDVAAGSYGLRQTGESLIFDGWGAVWPLELKGGQLDPAQPEETLLCQEIEKEQRFTKPAARYSEATLIKTLEEKGVGRPSTYATIVETLYDRGYVEKNEEKRIEPTQLGMTVDDFLLQYFDSKSQSPIVDTGFTAQMEEQLDLIEEDQLQWVEVVRSFWNGFTNTLEEAKKASAVELPEPVPEKNYQDQQWSWPLLKPCLCLCPKDAGCLPSGLKMGERRCRG